MNKIVLLTFMISGCVTSQSKEETTFYVEGEKTSIEVPFAMIDNRNFIDVYLNGKGPFKFVLDTGGGDGIVVTPEVSKQLGLKANGSEQQSGAGAEKEDASLAKVADVRIASIHLGHVKTIILSLDKIQNAIGFERFDGIIGDEMFSRFVTTLDFEKNTVQFTSSDAFHKPQHAIAVPLIIDGGPYVQATVGAATGRFLVDTGDRSSLSFCGPFADKFALLDVVKPKVEAVTGWGVGGPIPAKVGRVQELSMGPVTVKGVVTRFPLLRKGGFASQKDAGIIGNGVLKKFLVTFDYRHSEMLLTPNKYFAETDSYDRSGMWIGKDNGNFVVLDVVNGGPAAQAGVHVGDKIVAIDGTSSAGLTIDEVRSRLKAIRSASPKISFLSGSTTKETIIHLRDLL